MKRMQAMLLPALLFLGLPVFAQHSINFDPMNLRPFIDEVQQMPASRRDSLIKKLESDPQKPMDYIPGVSDSTLKAIKAITNKFSVLMLDYIRRPEQDTIVLKQQLLAASHDMMRLSVKAEFEFNVSKLKEEFVQTEFANPQQRENARKKMEEEIKALEEKYRTTLAGIESSLNKSAQKDPQ